MKRPEDISARDWVYICAANCRADLEIIAQQRKISLPDLLATNCIRRDIVRKRWRIAKELANDLGYSRQSIARAFGADHSTVKYWFDPAERKRRSKKNKERYNEKRLDKRRREPDCGDAG